MLRAGITREFLRIAFFSVGWTVVSQPGEGALRRLYVNQSINRTVIITGINKYIARVTNKCTNAMKHRRNR